VKFLHWIDRTNEIAGKAVSFIMIPMLLVMVFEVVMRYGFDAPTIWGTETATFIFAGYILLGGGYSRIFPIGKRRCRSGLDDTTDVSVIRGFNRCEWGYHLRDRRRCTRYPIA